MDFHLSLSSIIIILFLSFFLTILPLSYCDEDDPLVVCNSTYNCGGISIPFPFWGGTRPEVCGHQVYNLRCGNEYPVIEIEGIDFDVLNISSRTITIARDISWGGPCPPPPELINTTLVYTLFDHASTNHNITMFYGCHALQDNIPGPNRFNCSEGVGSDEKNDSFYLVDQSPLSVQFHERLQSNCDINIKVPILQSSANDLLHDPQGGAPAVRQAMDKGFEVEYSNPLATFCRACEVSGGVCGGSNSTGALVCYCRDQRQSNYTCLIPTKVLTVTGHKKWNLGLKIGIGFGAATGTVAIMLVIFFFYQRRNKKKYGPSSYVSRSISSYPSSMTDREMGISNYFGAPLFNYSELEEATKNFDSSKELGEGGFGTVYYGKLRDGREVAVKRLYENNCRRVEQFMNEIAILTRLRHQNLVQLYGCTSRHSRELVLVYEYIPNGTIADHLHGKKAKPGALRWPTRMKIALETASALTYLHASDIIHRDVKTNNILLDNNFCVKVADFGLSRLFPTDVSHVSTAPQGTPGYVDPEYHECYQLNGKSDVFSFGVVLIELISSMPAVDITRHRHEINLSTMAINKIQNHTLHELVDKSLGFQSDYRVQRMITAVAELAFQCLQYVKDVRPSMGEVLEALQDIQNKDYSKDEAEEMGKAADDVGLLKRDSLPLSPDSALNWISTSTTSTSSS
ncbi:LEAF RUST 10 DISEASE-RESISTANCE LOCUS RECEPTOR-LIKE PROTEIN KINASE-like 1.2 isoform X1 [Corylus avellana]|uniref:LEAF RUST 10 DISEASE-RESISTANCE LOCUS RECEPTOR-LIKE PROTEIN KINASE-like 1.2 isoform X1 n=1 Tax=Corylus avellana TaxID=13451 RepID=UPI00286D3CB1|nr:LEAF RUST 10 DISEASE-RESISTANCE LOCUS RECEPTOR-LIKE PROTEIN KINASE-like 1.2 isoform X1 [Corylus avellana]